MNRVCTFFAPGKPQAKGSMKAFVIGGKPRLTSSNKKLKQWENCIKLYADKHWHGPPGQVPVDVTVEFTFSRPKSHYNSKGAVKPQNVPTYMLTTPDVDKLLRGVLDGLTDVVIADDKYVVNARCTKRYGEYPGARVTVKELG